MQAAQAEHAEHAEQLTAPSLDLEEPGTIEFTAERALAGRALNRFALSLRSSASRAEFLADEAGYLCRFCLTDEEVLLVTGCGALVMAEPGALPGTGRETGPGAEQRGSEAGL